METGFNNPTIRPVEDTALILVVDDNPTIIRALSVILHREGYGVAAFQTGSEALEWAEDNTPAAAVVDIHLPDVSGLAVSAKLRERFGEGVPLIVLSGDTSIENLKSLSHIGASYFISKPFRSEHLVQYLRGLTPAGS